MRFFFLYGVFFFLFISVERRWTKCKFHYDNSYMPQCQRIESSLTRSQFSLFLSLSFISIALTLGWMRSVTLELFALSTTVFFFALFWARYFLSLLSVSVVDVLYHFLTVHLISTNSSSVEKLSLEGECYRIQSISNIFLTKKKRFFWIYDV